MDRYRIGWIVRGLALAAVFVMAVAAFRAGVDVSDRPGLPRADLLTQLYYAGGLFVLGGMDLGTPVSGPAFARGMLWTSYFLAPLITTSAVIEGALRLVGSRAFDRVGLRQHLFVVGLGRLGTTFVAAFRQWDKRCIIVAMDRDAHRAALDQVRRLHGVRVLPGDARITGTFASLSIEHARGVALLTEDDLLNLDVAFRLSKLHPNIPVVAHVSNISLQRAAADIERDASRRRLHVFNGHRVTAEYLFTCHLQDYFAATKSKDTVILAGFGRFGQTIFELLHQKAQAEIEHFLIADRTAALAYRTFESEVSCNVTSPPITVDGNLADPQTWQQIQQRLGTLPEPPVVILGSDNDSTNLKSALSARRYWPNCKAFVRFQHHSEFAEDLAKRHQFIVLGVDTMLLQALEEQQKTWFPGVA